MRLLLLAGTEDATQIAQAVAREDRVVAIASMAGPSRQPVNLGLPTRIGGWGGREAFRDWLQLQRIDAVLDATHPFATAISHRAAAVCAELGLDYLGFQRRAWMPGEGDHWTFLNSEADAPRHIPKDQVVVLMTGQRRIEAFAALQARRLYCPMCDLIRAPFPLAEGSFLLRRRILSVESEVAMLQTISADWIVMRNTGSRWRGPSLQAARALSLPIAMIRRPPQPEAPRCETISEALAWVRRRM